MRFLSEYLSHELTLYTGFARLSVSGGGVGGGGTGNVSATAEVNVRRSMFGRDGNACVLWGIHRTLCAKDWPDSLDSTELVSVSVRYPTLGSLND